MNYSASLERITKASAQKLYESGKTIWLNPSKMKLDNPWTSPMEANIKNIDEPFSRLINSFFYYNCSKETGKTIHFYKKRTFKTGK